MIIYRDHAAEVTVCYPFCDCCTDVELSFYTTDSGNTIDFSGDFLNVDGYKATVHFTRMQLQELEDGALRYIVKHNGKETTMSCDYYVKTPVNYQPSECHDDDELIEANEEGFSEGYNQARETITSKFKEVTITENGIYEKEGDFDAFKKVTVDVKSGEVNLKELYVSPNYVVIDDIAHFRDYTYIPEMGVDGYSKVTVHSNQIEELNQRNMRKAEEKGKEEGYNEGYEAGDADGYERGTADGYQDGRAEGERIGREEQKAEDDAKITPSIKITDNGIYTAEYGYKQVEVAINSVSPEFIGDMAKNVRGMYAYSVYATDYDEIQMPTRGEYMTETGVTRTSGRVSFPTYGAHIALGGNTIIDDSVGAPDPTLCTWHIYKDLTFGSIGGATCRVEEIYFYLDNDDMFSNKEMFDRYFNDSFVGTYTFNVKRDAELNYLPTYMEEREGTSMSKISIFRF